MTALRLLLAGIVIAVLAACNAYAPAGGLKHRAVTACAGYWQFHTNGYQYGDPRLRAWWTWVNTDRRPQC